MQAESFEKLCTNIRSRISNKNFMEFAGEKNRVSRFELFDKISTTDLVSSFLTLESGKDLEQAIAYKNAGNAEFKLGHWDAALEQFNESYLLTPGKTRECAIILGNRSAVLFHLKEYRAAIRDIEDAEAHFDPNTVHKLILRKAKCLMELRETEAAVNEFKRLSAMVVDLKKMPDAAKKTILDEVEMGLKSCEQIKQIKVDGAVVEDDWRNGEVIDAKYKFDYTEEEGRYAVCTADIPVGELLLSETPFCAVVLEEYSHTHCQLCCKRSVAPLACESCSDVVFCSNRCKAEATFHVYECGILRSFWKTKASVTCHLSMRMMCCYPLEFFIEIRGDLERKMTHTEIDALPSRDYRKAFALVTHEEGRTMEEIFQRTLMAKFLLNCLVSKGYLKGQVNLRSYIGNLILHNIQVLQFNAHEVFELQKDDNNDIGRTEFVGGAIFPVLALFNHSCDPATVRYFDGKRVHVRTIRPLKAGEQIGENYGPIFTQNVREERQLVLQNQYKFTCGCIPCTENWPLYKEMQNNKNILRFRCRNRECKFIVNIKMDKVEEPVTKCLKCGTKLNLIEPMKYLSKVDSMFDIAKNLFKQGKVDLALQMYLKLLAKLDELLVPPFTEYHVCQQGIRRCFLELGNVVKLKKSNKSTLSSSYFM